MYRAPMFVDRDHVNQDVTLVKGNFVGILRLILVLGNPDISLLHTVFDTLSWRVSRW